MPPRSVYLSQCLYPSVCKQALCCPCVAVRGRRWVQLGVEEQQAYVMRLLDALEVTDRDKRLKVARAILYLAQGTTGCHTHTHTHTHEHTQIATFR